MPATYHAYRPHPALPEPHSRFFRPEAEKREYTYLFHALAHGLPLPFGFLRKLLAETKASYKRYAPAALEPYKKDNCLAAARLLSLPLPIHPSDYESIYAHLMRAPLKQLRKTHRYCLLPPSPSTVAYTPNEPPTRPPPAAHPRPPPRLSISHALLTHPRKREGPARGITARTMARDHTLQGIHNKSLRIERGGRGRATPQGAIQKTMGKFRLSNGAAHIHARI
jgi:hypothetical protein